MSDKRKFVLIHTRAPGDILMVTSLVRDIQLAYPGRFAVDVDTSHMSLWANNPYLSPVRQLQDKTNIQFVKLSYGSGIKEQNSETIHFCAYLHRDFRRQTGLDVPCQLPYPDVHLSEEEKTVPLVEGRYWVMLSGGKSDFTIKVWETAKFQTVVNALNEQGLGVVQVGSTEDGHWHPKLDGVINLIGQTSLRDMLRLIYHADGVICGVTFAMHAAAALHRPCVVIAGGREAWWWEAYVRENTGFGKGVSKRLAVPHRFLHTIGLLDCCRYHGCWKNKVVPLHDDPLLCRHPVLKPGQPIPACMEMITVDMVVNAAFSYYYDGTLSTIANTRLHDEVESLYKMRQEKATDGILQKE